MNPFSIHHYKELLETCDLISENTFIFNHKWDMEVCKIPYTFEDKIEWTKIPFGDPEWTFMLNRHKFWIYLAKGYILTSNSKYLNKLFLQINSWIDNVDISKEKYKNCSRTIEIGIRCLNWIKTINLLKKTNCNIDEIEKKMISSLITQSKILIDLYDDFRILSNWGVMQNCGLISLSLNYKDLYPELENSMKLALERLKHQCCIQILRDGVHWENSPLYHNEVLNCLLDIAFDYEHKNIQIPKFILEAIKKLAYVDAYMKKPNHAQPIQGDSDEIDLRDIITRAAYILKDEELKYFGYAYLDSESIWYIGQANISKFDKIKTIPPKYSSTALKESGNFYLRDSFEENSNYLWFRCGSIGSGHGHAEHLHFDLVSEGEDFISDPGRFTYMENKEERELLRGCFSHNTTIVDEKPFSELSGAWNIDSSALTLNSYHLFESDFDYVDAGHLGYINLETPVITNRKILYFKIGIWVIIDEFLSEGSHKYSQLFNFNPNKFPIINTNKSIISGKKTNLFMYWSDKNIELKLKESIFSNEYNKKEKNFKLVSSVESIGNKTIFTIISSKELDVKESIILRGDKSSVPKNEAAAVEIKLDSKNKITVFNSMKDINNSKKSYLIDDALIYGRTGFIKNNKEDITIKIIKY